MTGLIQKRVVDVKLLISSPFFFVSKVNEKLIRYHSRHFKITELTYVKRVEF